MIYEVGKKYDFAIRDEGVVFDINDSGAILMVFFRHPKQEEIEQFQSGKPLEIRFVPFQNVIMILSKIGNISWMDSPYHPDLSMSLTELKEPEDGQGLSITIMLFDAVDGKLDALRVVGSTTDFTQKLYKEIRKISGNVTLTYSEYMNYLNQIFRKYQTKDLVKLSSIGFKIRGDGNKR